MQKNNRIFGIFSCHPVFITGSRLVDNSSRQPRTKCGVTSLDSAFTLIELSIVMVIIGLLVGGVLVGNDLIYAASVRAQITQIEQLETAINTFKVKYNCLPGDCANATDFFGTTSPQGDAVNIGNGDGIIKATWGSSTPYGAGECLYSDISGEVSQLFMQLFLAGIGKDYTDGTLDTAATFGRGTLIGKEYPYAKFGNGTGIFVSCLSSTNWPLETTSFMRQGNIIVIGATGASTSWNRIEYATGQVGSISYGVFGKDSTGKMQNPIGIPADVARRIDEKIDDGNPSTGKFGIIAGQTACDNALKSANSLPLLTAYPAPSVSCNATVGKRID